MPYSVLKHAVERKYVSTLIWFSKSLPNTFNDSAQCLKGMSTEIWIKTRKASLAGERKYKKSYTAIAYLQNH